MLFFQRTALLVTLGIASLAAAAPTAGSGKHARAMKCHRDAPYLIIAHGTSEKGEGALGSVASAFAAQVPGTGSRGFHYPANMVNYTHSEETGVRVMKEVIRDYVEQCGSNAKIMLLGYSQGANIVTDVLSGGSFYRQGKSNAYSLPLKEEYGKQIVAALLFGDPAFTANQPWDYGTSKQSGVVGMSQVQLQNMAPYAKMLRSYCDANDPYCASGKDTPADLQIHGEYFEKYTTDAVSWLVQMWNQHG